MRTYALDLDMTTGAVHALGTDGRRYSFDEIEAAEHAAQGGDAAAAALLRAVDHGVGADGGRRSEADLHALMDKIIHDCPECQAALARGEAPIRITGADIAAARARGGPRRKRRRRRR